MASSKIFPPAAVWFLLATPCLAGADPTLPDALQQEAMSCVGEAMQICPDVWTAQDHGLACMTGKRQSFSPRCRVIYDKVDHAIHPAQGQPRGNQRHDHADAHEANR